MRCWIAVASAEHVRIGVAGGFAQVNHGKAAPLRRLSPGDRLAYYSPSERLRGEPLRAFTAIGRVAEGEPYAVEVSPDFKPFRRRVDWAPVRPVEIASLLPLLDFTRDKRNWAAPLRFGLAEIGGPDMDRIAAAMTA